MGPRNIDGLSWWFGRDCQLWSVNNWWYIFPRMYNKTTAASTPDWTMGHKPYDKS